MSEFFIRLVIRVTLNLSEYKVVGKSEDSGGSGGVFGWEGVWVQ